MINMKNSEQASALYALLVAALFAFLSFYNTDAETYLFPRILAIVLALLSVILLVTNAADDKNADGRSSGSSDISAVWPGLLIGFIFLLIMEDVGFYISSFLAFLAILIVYGNQPIVNVKLLTIRVVVSAAFMLVLYLLFWNGLHVRTPTGILF